MLVMKFGGTSVGNGDAFAQVASIVADKVAEQAQTAHPGVAIVTSAMSGVTNLLIDAARRAADDDDYYLEAADALRVKHQSVAGQLIEDGGERAALGRLFEERLAEFTRLCSSIAVLGELTHRGLDVVSGLGERLSAPLLAAVLRAQGVPAEYVDATEIIVTDSVFGGAAPIMELTTERCRARGCNRSSTWGVVPVITGFIGATVDGVPTTLGRGGSDYSGAIVGSVLEADEIQIWTDVNGVMTADPRVVPNARSLRRLSYEEVAELAYYGAKVLHPKTVTPAIEHQIPLRVLNTFEPTHPGTSIVAQTGEPAAGTVKAITFIRGMNMITVAGKGMIGVPGIAARTFQAVAQVDANVLDDQPEQQRAKHLLCRARKLGGNRHQCAARRVQNRARAPLLRPHRGASTGRHHRRRRQRDARHTGTGRQYLPRRGQRQHQRHRHRPGQQRGQRQPGRRREPRRRGRPRHPRHLRAAQAHRRARRPPTGVDAPITPNNEAAP